MRCYPADPSYCEIRAIYPYRFHPADTALVQELARMINEENWRWVIGHFTLDPEDGELAYTKTCSCYGAPLDEASILTHLKQVRRRTDALKAVCDRILAQTDPIPDPLLEELQDMSMLEFSRADKVLVPEMNPAVLDIVRSALSAMDTPYQECEDSCGLTFSYAGLEVDPGDPEDRQLCQSTPAGESSIVDTLTDNNYTFCLKSHGFDLITELPPALRVDLTDERMVSETLSFLCAVNRMSPILHSGHFEMNPQSGRLYYIQTVEVSAPVLLEDTELFIEDMRHVPIIDHSMSILWTPIVDAQIAISWNIRGLMRIIHEGASASEVI